jgi:hypothetical protein
MTTCLLATLYTVATGNNMGRAKYLSTMGTEESMDIWPLDMLKDTSHTSHTSLYLDRLVKAVVQGAVRRQQGLVLCQLLYSTRI